MEDEPKAHPAPPAEGAKVLSGCYDVKIAMTIDRLADRRIACCLSA